MLDYKRFFDREITQSKMNREEIFQSLNRLRKGLLQIIIVFILSGIIIFPFAKTLLRYLYETNLKADLVAFAIPEAFFSVLKLNL
jgi:Sec-independent protein secretion pathway component TatC